MLIINTPFNISRIFINLKIMLNIWKQRKLSFKGMKKITISNNLALDSLAPLIYASSILNKPHKTIKEINNNSKLHLGLVYLQSNTNNINTTNRKWWFKTLSLWNKDQKLGKKTQISAQSFIWKIPPKLFYNCNNLNKYFLVTFTININSLPKKYNTHILSKYSQTLHEILQKRTSIYTRDSDLTTVAKQLN